MTKILLAIALLSLMSCANQPKPDDGSISFSAEEKARLANNIRQWLTTIQLQGAIIRQQQQQIEELQKGHCT